MTHLIFYSICVSYLVFMEVVTQFYWYVILFLWDSRFNLRGCGNVTLSAKTSLMVFAERVKYVYFIYCEKEMLLNFG